MLNTEKRVYTLSSSPIFKIIINNCTQFNNYSFIGVLLFRGYTPEELMNQCFGNVDDLGKGKQMPVHYGSKNHNFVTLSSPLTTQLPQGIKFKVYVQ